MIKHASHIFKGKGLTFKIIRDYRIEGDIYVSFSETFAYQPISLKANVIQTLLMKL
jgi:hypothetical protein